MMIPEDCLLENLSRLPTKTLCRLRTVSKNFQKLISDPYLKSLHAKYVKNSIGMSVIKFNDNSKYEIIPGETLDLRFGLGQQPPGVLNAGGGFDVSLNFNGARFGIKHRDKRRLSGYGQKIECDGHVIFYWNGHSLHADLRQQPFQELNAGGYGGTQQPPTSRKISQYDERNLNAGAEGSSVGGCSARRYSRRKRSRSPTSG